MDDGGKVEVERSDGFTNGQERNLLLTAPLDGSSRFECAVELTVNGHACIKVGGTRWHGRMFVGRDEVIVRFAKELVRPALKQLKRGIVVLNDHSLPAFRSPLGYYKNRIG